MPAANVTIHASQFPENVRRDLLESLRSRKVNHKFHYDSVKQTQKWLALHQAYSPGRRSADCRAIYEKSFKAAAAKFKTQRVHLIGLGCGGGRKDTRLLNRLKARGRGIFYTPCDVSTAMVLVARRAALTILPGQNCFPFVCDLATAGDLRNFLVTPHHEPGPSPSHEPGRADLLVGRWRANQRRRARSDAPYQGSEVQGANDSGHSHPALFTFFGMIPNFEPGDIVPKLVSLMRPNDWLLFSANLAPGENYDAGMKRILPQYDNALTRDWLMTFLLDLGVERRDGQLRFAIEEGDQGLKRIVARFYFRRPCRIAVEHETFGFKRGESVRLFFSYRYTPERVEKILAAHGMEVCGRWIAKSGEEGVFLCRGK